MGTEGHHPVSPASWIHFGHNLLAAQRFSPAQYFTIFGVGLHLIIVIGDPQRRLYCLLGSHHYYHRKSSWWHWIDRAHLPPRIALQIVEDTLQFSFRCERCAFSTCLFVFNETRNRLLQEQFVAFQYSPHCGHPAISEWHKWRQSCKTTKSVEMKKKKKTISEYWKLSSFSLNLSSFV